MTTIRVATAQFFSGTDIVANLQTCIQWMREAAAGGAQLIVMPENANRVRDYTTREQTWDHSEELTGAFVTGLRSACRELNLHAVVGVDLRGKFRPDVHIASVLIGSDGTILHQHLKHIFWDYEYTLFVPGTEPVSVVQTPLGRLGLMMCADGIVPEVPRLLALAGAQILCNSLNSRGPDEHRVHVPLRALENRVWHISSNTVGGPTDGYPWMGGSQVVSPDGKVVASAGESADQLVWADIDPSEADDKTTEGIGDVFGYRRPDLYGMLTVPVSELTAAHMYGAAGEFPSRLVRTAALQVSWFHNQEWTITRALGQMSYAASRDIRLGVFPEMFCFAPGEVSRDPHKAALTSARVLELISSAAETHKIRVVVHLVEAADTNFYSTAWLLGPDGRTELKYRKTHLSDAEKLWATAGDDLPVVQTSTGRIGIMLGDEVWVPEVARVLTVGAAEIIAHPTSWNRPEAATMAAVERAEENRVHVVSSARLDSPAGLGSQIVQADEYTPGQPIALMRYPTAWTSRAGFEEQKLVELDLREANSKLMGVHLDPVATRQPAIYSPLTVTPSGTANDVHRTLAAVSSLK